MEDKRGSGTKNTEGYRVEGRSKFNNFANPITLSDGILTKEWREIRFTRIHGAPIGVPVKSYSHDLIGYDSAMSLIHQVFAQHEELSGFIELRLVKYSLCETWALYRQGIVIGSEMVSEGWIRKDEVLLYPTDKTSKTPCTS